jgi:hypothetical protein
MTGITCMMASAKASSGIVSPFTAWHASGSSTGGTATGTLNFNADGTVTASGSTTNDTVAGSANWYSPTTGAIGSSYWVRLTPTSGTVSTGNSNVWTSLATNQTWTASKTGVGGKACTATIEIATDSGGTAIVLTSTGNIIDANVL